MDAELTWANLMARTHEAPGGFSSTHPAEAHFTTSVDVGTHIAAVVLARCEAAAGRHGIERPWIVDVGAGSGRLLAQLIALGFPADRLIGVDVRSAPDLPVHWIQGRAPGCVPPVRGLLFAHEFLDDVPVDVVADGQVVDHRGTPIGPAHPDDLAWLLQWTGSDTGVVGRRRDDVWRTLTSRVVVGEAIAVDYPTTHPVGHWRGRRTVAVPGVDISAGVELRSCREATGGRIVPQHRMLAAVRAQDVQETAELSVLRDREGLGAFGWLITDRP